MSCQRYASTSNNGALNWERVFCWPGPAGNQFQMLQHLMNDNSEREIISGEEKCEILDQCKHRCALCGSRGKLHFYHIVCHSESYGGARELQPLCEPCHLNKTNSESRNLDGTTFGSSFSKRVLAAIRRFRRKSSFSVQNTVKHKNNT